LEPKTPRPLQKHPYSPLRQPWQLSGTHPIHHPFSSLTELWRKYHQQSGAVTKDSQHHLVSIFDLGRQKEGGELLIIKSLHLS
jgi:hypothetical protein